MQRDAVQYRQEGRDGGIRYANPNCPAQRGESRAKEAKPWTWSAANVQRARSVCRGKEASSPGLETSYLHVRPAMDGRMYPSVWEMRSRRDEALGGLTLRTVSLVVNKPSSHGVNFAQSLDWSGQLRQALPARFRLGICLPFFFVFFFCPVFLLLSFPLLAASLYICLTRSPNNSRSFLTHGCLVGRSHFQHNVPSLRLRSMT